MSEEEIKARRSELEHVRGIIKEAKRRLNQRLGEERSILGRLERIAQDIAAIRAEIDLMETRQAQTLQTIEETRLAKRDTEIKLQDARRQFRAAARAHHRLTMAGWLKILLASDTVQELVRKSVLGRRISAFTLGRMQEPARLAKRLAEQEAILNQAQADEADQRKALEDQRSRLEDRKAQEEAILEESRMDQAHQESLIREMREAEAELKRFIGELASNNRLSTDFEGRRGELPWPIEGTLARRFGKEVDPQYQTILMNRGIEIQPNASDRLARAVHEGKALYADWFRGYGRMVVLDHGDGYYSVYAHIEDLRVELGESVTAGQPLGRIESEGEKATLYFEVRKGGEAQNPIEWLSPK